MDSGDWKGFIQAIINQDIELVKYYLSQPFDIDYIHPEMMTSGLIEAVRGGNQEIVKLLMERGANPKLKSPMGESPIMLAKKNKDLIKLLRDTY